jgi:hypothetical protein
VVVADGEYYGEMTPARVTRLLDDLRKPDQDQEDEA